MVSFEHGGCDAWPRRRAPWMIALLVIVALVASIVASSPAIAQVNDRPLPILDVAQQDCDIDSCALSWTPRNDLSTLRSWDVHVNYEYRTWVPIPDGPTVEFGPGAADPRMRDLQIGDVIQIIPVRSDGVWAPTDESVIFEYRNYGPDYGPGLRLFPEDFGTVAIGATGPEVDVIFSAYLGARFGWDGPSAVVDALEVVGPDADAFTIEYIVRGDLACDRGPEFCERETVTLPVSTFLLDQSGYATAVVVSFSPTREGDHRAELQFAHNGRDALATTELTGVGAEEVPDRPLPIVRFDGPFGCDVDSCSLSWFTRNDLSTLRSWDVHINGEYRTWVPINNGPTIEYGPGAADPRLRDLQIGDAIQIIPVRTDGVWAPTDESAIFEYRNYGPDFGPGVEVSCTSIQGCVRSDGSADFGTVAVGTAGDEAEVVMTALDGNLNGCCWTGPDAVVTSAEIIGTDADAFQIERVVSGQLSCPPGNCERAVIELPTTVFEGDQNGFGTALVITFSPTRDGAHEAELVVSHNGREEVTRLALTGTGQTADDRPLPIVDITDLGCDQDGPCAIEWTPRNDPATLRSWDVHVNGRYRTWVRIDNGPTIEFGPGAADPRLQTVESGDVIRIIPVRPDGVWAPTGESANFVVDLG